MDNLKKDIPEILNKIKDISNLKAIKTAVEELVGNIRNCGEVLQLNSKNKTISVSRNYLIAELEQILETRTISRTEYYINRLIKSLTMVKTGKINDINLNRWKEYNDIVTDSLWDFDKRDKSSSHSAGYWGNFIPQIPNQLLRRYTKKGDWILDGFLGSGTTLIECEKLGRNGIGIELQENVMELAQKNVSEARIDQSPIIQKTILGDSSKVDIKAELQKLNIANVQFVFLHPPYWDIIKFSEDDADLSNAGSVEHFLDMFCKVVDNTVVVLERGRYFAIVIGDKYSQGEWIPLGFYTMNEVMKRGYKLKSTIVKNFKETTAKRKQKELWRYRALVGGFYIFKHEYIFLFQK